MTIPEAVAARADGIKVFVIGVTVKTNEVELKGMSSMPQVRRGRER